MSARGLGGRFAKPAGPAGALPAAQGDAASEGTALAGNLAERTGKPLLQVGLDDPQAPARTRKWLDALVTNRAPERPLALGIGGPRESEAPGIYQQAVEFLQAALRGVAN